LTAVPAFAVLNKMSISFFDTESVHSLINSFPLKDIAVDLSNQMWTQSNCLAIQGIDGTKDPRVADKKGYKAIFCSENKELMNSWAKAIDTFHRCTITEMDSSNSVDNTVTSKINRKALVSDEKLEESRKKSELGAESSYAESGSSSEEAEGQQMSAYTRKLLEEYKKHQEIQMRRRMELREERKQYLLKQKRLGSLAKCVETALNVKAIEDEKSLEKLLSQETANKEKDEMRKAELKMKELMKMEDEKVDDQEYELKMAAEKVRSKMKDEIIQESSDWTKDLDPLDCYRDNLSGGNLVAMKQVCTNTIDYGAVVDLKVFLNCLNKKFFCPTCCGYYIGAANEKDKQKCIQRCEEIVNSDSNAYIVTYGLKGAVVTGGDGGSSLFDKGGKELTAK